MNELTVWMIWLVSNSRLRMDAVAHFFNHHVAQRKAGLEPQAQLLAALDAKDGAAGCCKAAENG